MPVVAWRENLIEDAAGIERVLAETRRVAVLGIKTEAQSAQPAFYVPAYLARAGLEVIAVPVYYPDAAEILGSRVYRRVAEVPGEVDLVDVFRRSRDVAPHVTTSSPPRPRRCGCRAASATTTRRAASRRTASASSRTAA